ncbi:hypothetical protein RJ641_000205 [Dillenia turbinata]|uniref:Uncharacterized protein n=1 Tax=Dillenia turbinata TaxID=194707 RepID=A0AAN8WE76_9MAGN
MGKERNGSVHGGERNGEDEEQNLTPPKKGRDRSTSKRKKEDESDIEQRSESEPEDDRRRSRSNERTNSKRRSRRRYSDEEDSSDSSSDYSESESGSESESSEESEEERRRRKRRERRWRREREERERKKRRREKEKKKRRREKDEESNKKRRRREKKEKEKGKVGDVTNSWGKYGIIKETDMWNKRPEFSAWLAEVKQVNLESLQNWEEKKLFKDFMEDHNTATFPSKKYYDLDAYHIRKMKKEQKKGYKKAKEIERTVFNDEEQRRQELLQEREKQKGEQVEALKRSMQSGMAQAMKEQAQLREEMAYQYKLGNFEHSYQNGWSTVSFTSAEICGKVQLPS